MNMEGMNALPSDEYFAKVYWMLAGGFIGLAILVHLRDLLEYRLRYMPTQCKEN